MTKGDKIRRLSNEELAMFLSSYIGACPGGRQECHAWEFCTERNTCYAAFLAWLNKEDN